MGRPSARGPAPGTAPRAPRSPGLGELFSSRFNVWGRAKTDGWLAHAFEAYSFMKVPKEHLHPKFMESYVASERARYKKLRARPLSVEREGFTLPPGRPRAVTEWLDRLPETMHLPLTDPVNQDLIAKVRAAASDLSTLPTLEQRFAMLRYATKLARAREEAGLARGSRELGMWADRARRSPAATAAADKAAPLTDGQAGAC